jgi:hypothetical protein
MRYRAFVGMWDDGKPEWSHVDVVSDNWAHACELLADKLRGFEDYGCDFCRDQARGELARLMAEAPGKFEGEVDGTDYLIMPVADSFLIVHVD